MKLVIRKGVFETNSSSDSALFFSDKYPKDVEREFDVIYEITNDPYKKLYYAFAFLVGDDVVEPKKPTRREIKKYFLDYYSKKYKVEITRKFEEQLEKDTQKICSIFFSTIGIGDTCLKPLLDKYFYSNWAIERTLPPAPPTEIIRPILIKYFHAHSYVAYAKDQLY